MSARNRIASALDKEIDRLEKLRAQINKLDDRILAKALATFESAPAAANWLTTPISTLENQTPAKVAQTAEGRKKVEHVLGCIEFTIPP